MATRLVVCISCRFAPDRAVDASGRTGGALFADMIEAAIGNRCAPVDVVRHECLWACKDHCAVLIEAEGKTGYLAGRFGPEPDAVAALLDWTAAYRESILGQVPYKAWPEGMKGHFIARIPRTGPAEKEEQP